MDAAFIWGPIAGYVNKTALDNVVSHRAGERPRPAVAGRDRLRSGQTTLRQEVDQVIDSVAGEIEALKSKYGLPTESPDQAGAERGGAKSDPGSGGQPAG